MNMVLRRLIWIGIGILIIVLWGTSGLEAGILRNRKDEGVVLGKWQAPASKEKAGKFLSVEQFEPGDKLAVKIFLEKPAEQVALKLIIQLPMKIERILAFTVQDGGEGDLLANDPAIILYELVEILPDQTATYIVKVEDQSERKPVVRMLEGVDGTFAAFGKTVSHFVNNVLNIPDLIAVELLYGKRDFTALSTLVIANIEGEVLKTLKRSENTDLQTPVWLSNDRILFVEIDQNMPILKVISATLEGTPTVFGDKPIAGTQLHLTPDRQRLIFLQGSTIMYATPSGKTVKRLFRHQNVTELLGVIPDADPSVYHLIFREGDDRLWLATLNGRILLSKVRVANEKHWRMLANIQAYGDQFLYERRDDANGAAVWNIYLKQTLEQTGVKITSDLTQDRYPAWSPDGANIVYVSGEQD